ncbi:helix-turn-helix domain-containing protein [Rhodoligotrophos appendicifer]|uniref:helix-turn-helix domain-containing protein n=1 Tax=Rhodoligotrophos appendicifer TaxID=987056 RepID=UPI00118509F0|nr:helix-turn-helix transcriptional regulator [Rhodoligotrophos appendicifer]
MIQAIQIRSARTLLGLSQAELATAAGISETGLSNIERGRVDPKCSTLCNIIIALEQSGVCQPLWSRTPRGRCSEQMTASSIPDRHAGGPAQLPLLRIAAGSGGLWPSGQDGNDDGGGMTVG